MPDLPAPGLAQYERLLKIEKRLRRGPPPDRRELAEMLEVSERTLQRDMDYLRDRMGAPLQYDRRQKGYRFSEESWFLPQVTLTEGDLFAFDHVLQWILSMGADVSILEPEELKQIVKKEVARMAKVLEG